MWLHCCGKIRCATNSNLTQSMKASMRHFVDLHTPSNPCTSLLSDCSLQSTINLSNCGWCFVVPPCEAACISSRKGLLSFVWLKQLIVSLQLPKTFHLLHLSLWLFLLLNPVLNTTPQASRSSHPPQSLAWVDLLGVDDVEDGQTGSIVDRTSLGSRWTRRAWTRAGNSAETDLHKNYSLKAKSFSEEVT